MKIKRRIVIFTLLLALIFTNITVININAASEQAGIWEGEYYYIKNVASGLYLEVNTSSENVRVASFTGAKNQKWRFKLKSNGTYVLIPGYDTSQRLDVYSANNAQNANVDIWPVTSSTDQEWQVSRSSSSTYSLRSGCSNFTKYLSAVGTTSGANVVQSDQYATNQRMWTLEKVDKGWADHFPSKITNNLDTTAVNSVFTNYCTDMGYYTYIKTNSTADNAYSMMYDDIWIYNGHGYNGQVCFNTSSGVSNGNIVAATAMKSGSKDRAVSEHAFNFISGNRCTLLMACLAGKSEGNYNLVDAIFDNGAQFVLGPLDVRYDVYDNMWIEAFLKACSQKKTIKQALAAADIAAPQSSNYYSRGNTYQKLNP